MIIKVSDISASYAKYSIQLFNSDIHSEMATLDQLCHKDVIIFVSFNPTDFQYSDI